MPPSDFPPRRLPFDVSVLVRAHADGTVTASVLGQPGLVAWGPSLDAVREDLELAVIDRLERAHPARLPSFQAPRGRALVEVEIPEAIELLADPPELRATRLPAVTEPDPGWTRVWVPAIEARLWVAEGEDVHEAVRELVARRLPDLDAAGRWALRPERGSSLVALTVEADTPSLARFTGENAERAELEPSDPEEEAERRAREREVPTPTLDRVGLALHEDRARAPTAHGRDAEVEELLRALARPGAAVVVVGPDGCGKSAVIDEVVRRWSAKAWFADASRLVDVQGMFSDWRRQTADLVAEVAASGGLWCAGDPVHLLDAGKHVGSEMNVAQVLKALLPTAGARVLAECSESTWGRLEARDAGFARLFTPWRLREPEPGATRAILDAIAAELPVPVAADGVEAVLGLTRRYGPPDARLGPAAHALRRLSAEAAARGGAGPLGRLDAIGRFCAESGLPELLVRDELPLDPDALTGWFRGRLVGQDAAVAHLVDLVAVIKGGLSDLGRPLGSFLFVGPTGVGKTEASKTLATWLFGDPGRLVRFDMSEFAGADCLMRLLDRESGLVARVRRQPFCVVLLDEIEKAHPAVFDLLLQVLGEARLSDPDGRTADFRNAVILMTSNLGVGSFARPSGFGVDLARSLRDHVLAEVERFFRPELFNRIDRVVPFASLEAGAIGALAEREVRAVGRREGLRGTALELGDGVVPWLAERGVDPRLGARPLKRAVADHLVAPLARHLAGGGRAPVVRVEVADGRLAFANRDGEVRRPEEQSLWDAVERASALRHLAGVWAASEAATSRAHEIRLVDRLMAGRAFWADGGAARARATALAPARAALEALDAARAQVLAVEELAHEAWLARAEGAAEGLDAALEEAGRALDEAGLGLVDLAFPRPDRAALTIAPEPGAGELCRRLTAAYLGVASARGWSAAIRPGSAEAWRGEPDALARRLKASGWDGPFRAEFEGPHAAALLVGEEGAHVLREPRESRVSVAFAGSRAGSGDRLARRFDLPRGQLVDLGARLTTTLHARWDRSLLEVMRLGVLVRALGAATGERIWRATEPWPDRAPS